MKKVFSVFVAGSKDLKQERDALRVVAQKLNTRYKDQNFDVFVELKSYEEFKDKQKEYEEYIKETADMVVFVLDGRIGEFTTKELKAADEANKQKGLPEIVVYLKEYEKETEEIRNIQNTLKTVLDDHFYVDYKDIDDLRTKVSERIRGATNSADHTRGMKKWRMISILIAVAALLLMGGLTYYSMNKLQKQQENNNVVHFDDEPILLFLGGGSVANFFKEELKFRVDSLDSIGFHNTIFLGVPTGDLWSIIGEEYYKSEGYFKGNDKYYPVFLAASQIDTGKVKDVILAKDDVFKISNKMLIFELDLGKDTVITYFNSSLKDSIHYYVDSNRKLWQNQEQLKNTIDTALKSKILYTTTLPSGTWKAYKEVLNDTNYVKSVEENQSKRLIYNDSRDLSNGNFVVLGSGYYFPKMPPNKKKIYVCDSNNEFKMKELYLYFIAYSYKGGYIIPEQVVRFLNIIESRRSINPINKINVIKWNNKGFVDVGSKELPKDGVVRLSLGEIKKN